MNSKILLITAIIVLVIVGGITVLSQNNNNKTTTANTKVSNTQSQTTNRTSTTVILSDKGFEPAVLNIKAGTQVIWTNESANTATVNSDNHPAHLQWPFLNLGTFKKGETVSVVVEKTGTYTYHNHFNPSQQGKIIVE